MNVKAEGITLQRSAINIGDPTHTVSHDASSVIKRIGLGKPSPGIEIISQQSDNRLAYGETATGQDYKHPLSGLNEAIHLATDVDLIKTCIGPRIRSQYQTFSCGNSQTICHLSSGANLPHNTLLPCTEFVIHHSKKKC